MFLTSAEKKKPTKADLMYLIHILAVIKKNGFDNGTINQFIDLHLSTTESERPLQALQSAVRLFYDGLSSEIAERLLHQNGNEVGDVLPNMHQPKYKLNVISKLTGYSRQTINNWTKNKGGYLRCFEIEGSAKFILEEDLIKKLEDVGCMAYKNIDDDFRKRYEYKIKM